MIDQRSVDLAFASFVFGGFFAALAVTTVIALATYPVQAVLPSRYVIKDCLDDDDAAA